MDQSVVESPQAALQRFGLQKFRAGQEEVINTIMDGQDCLCIMPTGGGKSLCYQLPSIARKGITLVVSPLIALMKDQVDSLQQIGVRATCINSSLSSEEQYQRTSGMTNGEYDLVYVAPERFRNPSFIQLLHKIEIQLLAVDEAHCISQWGHDFRPDYARLGDVRERLGSPQTVALTATATPTVREDVIRLLGLQEPRTFVTGFARDNLRFEVAQANSQDQKNAHIIRLLKENPGPGIIYCSTRKSCEELVTVLREAVSTPIGFYHAGLDPDDRRAVQEAFMSGKLPIIVATNAFGMGINKADVRFVVHYAMPGSIEAYYQEAGRAGRDGQWSQCVLLFSWSDTYIQRFFVDCNYPPLESVRAVYEFLRRQRVDPIEMTQSEVKELMEIDLAADGVGACERILAANGAIEQMAPRQNMATVKLESDLPSLVSYLPKESKSQRKVLRALEKLCGDRRFEHVYFRPEDVANELGMSREAFQRAIRELKRLEPFDYVPPFRGRAIHVKSPETPFHKLDIDFKELDERRDRELQKIADVASFAETRTCRQLQILNYFGERHGKVCGKCDICQPIANAPRVVEDETPISEHLQKAVQIVLSGVARTKGRVGKNAIAQMLCGSKSAKMNRGGLKSLSTYGLLRFLSQAEVQLLLDELLKAGLIEQSEPNRFRPIILLSPKGNEVMRGRAPLRDKLAVPMELMFKLEHLRSPDSDKADSSPIAESPKEEAAVEEPESSAESAEDATTHEQTFARVDQAEFDSAADSEISCSETVLDESEQGGLFENSDSLDETAASADVPQAEVPDHHWTWRLLSAGFSVSESMKIRGVPQGTVYEHAIEAGKSGLALKANWFFAESQLIELKQLEDEESSDQFTERQLELYRLATKRDD